MPLLSGDIVDRYVIDGFLGAGGMGEVYRAHDARLERSVALKIVRAGEGGSSSSGRSSDGSARMLREARAAAALNHPNVVAIYDVGQITAPGPLNGTTYIAMELVNGNSLRAYVGDASVPVDERVRWLTDAARALAAAHEAGIVHRDVKPENVMVRSDGIVKVLDFGIAKRAPVDVAVSPSASTDATTAGVVLGTPTYMAPEQLRGEPLDGRADQFAWGVVAYELFAGKPPWAREAGAFVVASKILSDEVVSADALGDAPPLVAAAIVRSLRKDRARRFGSMEELIEALTGVFAKRANVSTPSTPPKPDATQGTERDSAMSLPAPALHDAADDPPSGDESANTREPAVAPTALLASPRSWRRRAAVVATLVLAGAAATAIATRRHGGSTGTAPSSSAIAAPAHGCSGNRSCVAAHSGEPWICRAADGACVPIASEDCHARFDPEDLTRDDTVWLGVMLPLTGPRADAHGKTDANVLDLARRDFAGVGGVLGPGDALRRVGLVVCDANANPKRAAAHLVDLETPVVLGGAVSLKDTIDVVANVFVPSRTLTFDLLDESPLVTRIPQPPDAPRLVWRLTSSAEQGGEALAHLLSDHVEPMLRRAGGPLAGERAMKLAVVRSDAPTPAAILEAFVSKVSMNGKPLVDNLGNFRQHTFTRARGAQSDAARASVVADLVALAPHAIVYAESEVFEDAFVQAIERAWRAPYRPMYLSEGVLANPRLGAFLGANVERRRRFLSVELPANTDENFRFVLHYNEYFDPKLTPGTAPGVIYDAFYVAAYAAAASGKERLNGAAIAAAMERIGGSEAPIGVGPSHIFEAYEALRQGKHLRLTGAGTQLELDHATGEIPTDFAVYCVGVDRDGRAAEPVESGLRFDHRKKRVEGTMRCP